MILVFKRFPFLLLYEFPSQPQDTDIPPNLHNPSRISLYPSSLGGFINGISLSLQIIPCPHRRFYTLSVPLPFLICFSAFCLTDCILRYINHICFHLLLRIIRCLIENTLRFLSCVSRHFPYKGRLQGFIPLSYRCFFHRILGFYNIFFSFPFSFLHQHLTSTQKNSRQKKSACHVLFILRFCCHQLIQLGILRKLIYKRHHCLAHL